MKNRTATELVRFKGRVYAALAVMLCSFTFAARAQTVEGVLKALQQRALYAAYANYQNSDELDGEGRPTGLPKYPDDPTSIVGAKPIQWPNGVQAYPADGSITNVKDAIAALNTASRVFDAIKSQYLAYDPAKHRLTNLQSSAGEVYSRGISIPSVGTFDENNWRTKLIQLASSIEQLRALRWYWGSKEFYWSETLAQSDGQGSAQIGRTSDLGITLFSQHASWQDDYGANEYLNCVLGMTISTSLSSDWLSAHPGATSLGGSVVTFKQAPAWWENDEWVQSSNKRLLLGAMLPVVVPGTSGDFQIGSNSDVGLGDVEESTISIDAAKGIVFGWLDVPAPNIDGTVQWGTSVVFAPAFEPLLPAAAKRISAEAPALGVIETTVTNKEMLRVHLGRGNTDLNQIGWLGSEPDGFGSLLFFGSPAEFDVRYEEDFTQFQDQPVVPVTFQPPDDPDRETLNAAGFDDWSDYIGRYLSPRLKQVKGGDILAVITYITPYSKKIDLYWASNAGADPGPTGFYTPAGTPFKTIFLENPTAGGSGFPTERRHLRLNDSNTQYYESIATVDDHAHWTISFKMGSAPDGGDWQKTLVESDDKWSITETRDGLSSSTEMLFTDPNSLFTERPEPDSVMTTKGGEQRAISYLWTDSDPNGVASSGGAYGDPYPRVVSQVDYSGPASWAENQKSIAFDSNGLPSYAGFWFGGQWKVMTHVWNGNSHEIHTTLNGAELPLETRTYSGLTGLSIGFPGLSPTTYNFNDGSGTSGAPWCLSLAQYPGGYKQAVSTFAVGADMETDISEGWGAGFASGTVTKTRTNRYGGLVSKTVTTTGGGVLDSASASSWTGWGAPKDVAYPRNESEHASYVEGGISVGSLSNRTDRYGVTASFGYDWLGRPNSIATGFESITPDYSNPLVSSFTSNAGYSGSRNFSAFGDLRGGNSTSGVPSSFTINPTGQSSTTVDGRPANFSVDPTGFVSSVDSGQGRRGEHSAMGVEGGLFYVDNVELTKGGAASANAVRTYYDALGRVVKIRRPAASGGLVTETWNYNDANRTVIYNPGTGPVAQEMTSTLSPDGSTLTVQRGVNNYLRQTRSVAGNAVAVKTERWLDSTGQAASWVEVSNQSVDSTTGSASFTPWGLNANTVTLTDSVGQRQISGGLTNDTLTIPLNQGLPTGVNGTLAGRNVTLGASSSFGITTGITGHIGGLDAGMTMDRNGRITSLTGPGSSQNIQYGNAGGGFQVTATDNGQGTVSSFAADAVGDATSIATPDSLSLTLNTTDTANGRQTTVNGLQINSNFLGSTTGKTYAGGMLGESYSFNGDGSIAAIQIGGSSASFTQTPNKCVGEYGDATVTENFYNDDELKDISAPDDGRNFTYQNMELKKEAHTAGPWAGWTVERLQDDRGRLQTIRISQQGGGTRDFGFRYDNYSRLSYCDGLVNAVYEAPGAAGSARDAAGNLSKLTRGSLITTWSFDANSGLLGGVSHTGLGTFAYGYPSYDQRRRIKQRTASPGVGWSSINYGDASQLTGAVVSSSSVPLSYHYNGRGNRDSGVASGGSNFTQTPNNLDQILSRSLSGRGFGVTGAVNPSALVSVLTPLSSNWESLTVAPVTGAFSGFWPVPNTYNGGAAALMNVTVRGTLAGAGVNGTPAVADSNLNLLVPPVAETLQYDDRGRLKSDAFWTYTWNNQDRLTRMVRKPGTITEVGASGEQLDFSYDADGRRTRKTHSVSYVGKAPKIEYSQVLWSGWLPVMEDRYLNGTKTGRRWFQWGADCSGTLEGAGGIGGLVAIFEEGGRTLLPVEDGLGNIMAVVDVNTSQTVARYDHGPFGEPLGESGDVDACPFRYQTKFYDKECQHYYFGYRHYDPRMGRWLSRDPMGEAGGFNLYAYCGNDPANRHDPLGLASLEETLGLAESQGYLTAEQLTSLTLTQSEAERILMGYAARTGHFMFEGGIPHGFFSDWLNRGYRGAAAIATPAGIENLMRSTFSYGSQMSALRGKYPGRTDAELLQLQANSANSFAARKLLIDRYWEWNRVRTPTAGIGELALIWGLEAPVTLAGRAPSMLKEIAVGRQGPSIPAAIEQFSLDARLLTQQTHRAWAQNLSRINRSVERFGERALRLNSNDPYAAETAFEAYLGTVQSRLVRLGSKYRLEIQPAAVPGRGRVDAFIDRSDLGILGEIAYPGSRRLDAGVIDITRAISNEGFYDLVSGFDITLNPFKPHIQQYYQEAFGPIPIFDIRLP